MYGAIRCSIRYELEKKVETNQDAFLLRENLKNKMCNVSDNRGRLWDSEVNIRSGLNAQNESVRKSENRKREPKIGSERKQQPNLFRVQPRTS
jgi:hypothetical protein